jgi:hypothetical protein
MDLILGSWYRRFKDGKNPIKLLRSFNFRVPKIENSPIYGIIEVLGSQDKPCFIADRKIGVGQLLPYS